MVGVFEPMRDPSKSSMKRLVEYITDTKGNPNRVLSVNISNCSDFEDVDLAVTDMEVVQAQNTRTKLDKTCHIVLSFNEQLDIDKLHRIEREVCTRLGMGENQRISVIHGDTDHLHMHLAINRIHPKTFKMIKPYNEMLLIQKICADIEKEYNLIPDNHETKTHARETAAKKMEKAGDLQSFTGFLQRNFSDKIKSATSWEEIHSMLAENGIELKERGAGLVFVSGKIFVKASAVDRDFSKGKLTKRLGAFRPNTNKVAEEKTYKVKPMGRTIQGDNLWGKYRSFRDKENEEKRKNKYNLQVETAEKIQAANADYSDFESALISTVVDDETTRSILFALKRQDIARKKKAIIAKYGDSIASVKKENISWRNWVQEEAKNGNEEALSYLRNRAKFQYSGTSITGTEQHPQEKQPIKVTLNGTLLFENGVRDTGTQILIPRNAEEDEEVIRQALEQARARFGNTLTLNGKYYIIKEFAKTAGKYQMDIQFTSPEMEVYRKHSLSLTGKVAPEPIPEQETLTEHRHVYR